MKFAFAAILAVALSASQAMAQSIPLHPGETVTVRFEGGKPIAEGTTPARPMTKYEAYILWRAQTQAVPPGVKEMPPGFAFQGEGPSDAPHPSDGRLQITMRRVPGIAPGAPDGTMLLLENGYASALRYRADMRSGNRLARTDVCDAVPHLLGLEYWPYVIDELDLSNLRLIDSNGTIRCQ